MGIESKEKKNTPKGERIDFTKLNFEKLMSEGFFLSMTKAAIMTGSLPLVALFGGLSLIPDLAMKDSHPLMDKLGGITEAIFGKAK